MYRYRMGLWFCWIRFGLEKIESFEFMIQCKGGSLESFQGGFEGICFLVVKGLLEN